MKVKVLSRSKERHTRSTKDDIHPVAVNVDPKLHPLEAPREYQRALNATKLERAFAKPFVGSLDGHKDGVFCMAKHPHRLSWLLSGACDGEVRLWDLSTQECIHSAELHHGFVQGLCTTPSGQHFISVGQDKAIRIARLDDEHITASVDDREEAITLVSKTFFTGVDHHRKQDLFATSGTVVDLWSASRSEPVTSFSWGADTVTSVKFNPVEVNVLATSADDRNIALYDCRAATPIRKVILEMRTNAIAWNPMEAFNFTVANEDHNLYTFDMRKLKTALNVHKDHVSAVLDVDYSPTGREFVSGSYVLHFLRHLGVIDRLPFLCLSPLRFSCSLFPLQISKRRHENAVKMALTSSLFGVKQIRSHCAYLPVQSWAISRSVPH
mmetsp:Transcript_19367/g.57569  ORF Transcript_19367/g.57569 Transcript_19367/m.57569 type:complete len:382 (-) Transcript_19367:615-1760(-)